MGSTPTGRFSNATENSECECGVLERRCDSRFISDVSHHRQHVGKFGIPSVLGTEDRRFESGRADLY